MVIDDVKHISMNFFNLNLKNQPEFTVRIVNQLDQTKSLSLQKYENKQGEILIDLESLYLYEEGDYEMFIFNSNTGEQTPVYCGTDLSPQSYKFKNNELSRLEVGCSEDKVLTFSIRNNDIVVNAVNTTFSEKLFTVEIEVCGEIDLKGINPILSIKKRSKSNKYGQYVHEHLYDIEIDEVNNNLLFQTNLKEILKKAMSPSEVYDLFLRLEDNGQVKDYPIKLMRKDFNEDYQYDNKTLYKFKPFSTIYNTLSFIFQPFETEVYLSEINKSEDSLNLEGAIISSESELEYFGNKTFFILKSLNKPNVYHSLIGKVIDGIFQFKLDDEFLRCMERNSRWRLFIRTYNAFDNHIDFPVKLFGYQNQSSCQFDYQTYSVSLQQTRDQIIISINS
ncbi:hypothetical protein [Bacillus haynesii]|uniref:hypothetical protein n=1 Tax=Bacillus haynesii TaxID=1925021 RepID=UPI00228072DB|nr:hypothetical protein [Bacillus haynesii]MCY8557053.1 hypothetical protein [Bacillus haynesii]